jgi:hypothetical protein
MNGRGRQLRADREISQPTTLIVFSKRFDYLERTIDGMCAAIVIWLRVKAGIGCFAPGNLSFHHGLPLSALAVGIRRSCMCTSPNCAYIGIWHTNTESCQGCKIFR